MNLPIRHQNSLAIHMSLCHAPRCTWKGCNARVPKDQMEKHLDICKKGCLDWNEVFSTFMFEIHIGQFFAQNLISLFPRTVNSWSHTVIPKWKNLQLLFMIPPTPWLNITRSWSDFYMSNSVSKIFIFFEKIVENSLSRKPMKQVVMAPCLLHHLHLHRRRF